MKKVIIIGCPGSGKSTFGRKLKSIIGLPLYHLDMMYWNKDKTTVSKDIFIDRLQKAMNNPEWIIDGNYSSTMEMRFRACDTVFFLDYPTDICQDGIRSRKGKSRSDMPWIENDDTDEEFISFIENYNIKNRPEVITLIKKYSEKNIVIFHSRKNSEEYLIALQKNIQLPKT